MLLGCASREVAYRRSLAAPHLSDFARHLPRSDFEQITEILSQRTRQSITDIQPYTSDQVIVYTAFPGAEGPGLSVSSPLRSTMVDGTSLKPEMKSYSSEAQET
jgi:hypothetical protein